ncbi:unnamed protein product [Trichobilharzia szidati]|nr:unnamed protein product [Trichobilharzia szidati]
MTNLKTAGRSRMLNREFEKSDKFPKRVIVFLVVMCFITLGITIGLAFIPKKEYQLLIALLYLVSAIIEVVVVCVLMIYDRIRNRFPANFFLALLHSACLTALTEFGFIGKDYKLVLIVMAIAVVLYIICISIGATMRSELQLFSPRILTGYVVLAIVIAVATLAVRFSTRKCQWSLPILAAGMTVILIPFALFMGQITLGLREFRGFDPDYCTASMAAHVILLLFLVMVSIGIMCPEEKV